MTAELDEVGYEQTRTKLAAMEQRLKALEKRSDLHPDHLADARQSCLEMMQQYSREIKLYEAKHPRGRDTRSPLP